MERFIKLMKIKYLKYLSNALLIKLSHSVLKLKSNVPTNLCD